MAKRRRRLPPGTDVVRFLGRADAGDRRAGLALLGEAELEALDRGWPDWAHGGQAPPATCPDGAAWRTWVLMAGRGFGKTFAGAKWITRAIAAQAEAGGDPLRIALVGATLDDARRIMVEGRSGLLAVAEGWISAWHPSMRRLTFRTGAEAVLFSGASPESLRGPEHHLAWCDELAKWEKPRETWEMLQLGLRLGDDPRALVTTTPRAGPVLHAIMAEPGTIVTGGRTRANPHVSKAYQARVHALYGGTRLGRQELDGELITEAPGQLWTPELLERCRISFSSPAFAGEGDQPQAGGAVKGAESGVSRAILEPESQLPLHQPSPSAAAGPPPHEIVGRKVYERALIAIDPPSGGGTCGIIACAKDALGIAHVLADHSVTGLRPEGWAAAVAAAAAAHGTVEVIAEKNQGGEMIRAVLATADPALRVKLVTAKTGKTERATPVAHLFEAGRVVLHGRMPALERELLGMIAGGDYEAVWTGAGEAGKSPDRADAMVWGVTELLLGKARGKPRIVGF